jgi:tetratricopeptide (TPR) repeat protein
VPPGPALLGAGLFAVHPVASSCVYPISGREALLCAGFVIAASWAFLRGGVRWRMTALAAFGAALLCREQAVVVPFLLVLADALGLPPDAPGRRPRRWLLRHLPFAAVLLLYLAVRSVVLASANVHRMALLDEPMGPLLSFAYFLQTAFTPFVELVYEPRPEVWASPWRRWVWPLAVGVLAVLALRGRARLGTGALFWVGWVVLGVLPTANLLRQEAPFAERHILLSLLGVVGVVCMLCATVWSRTGPRRAVVAAGVVLLVGCSAVSFHRGRYFHDNLAFFEQWIQTDADAPQAHLSLGDWYDRAGRLDDAVAEYRTVLAAHPRHVPTRYSLGEALLKRGEVAEAATHLGFVVRYQPKKALPRYRLGVALLLQDRIAEAAAQFQETVQIDPRHAHAHSKLGVVRARDGRHAEAVVHYRRALALDPELAEARHNLAVSLEKLRPRGAAEAGRPPSP